MINSVSQFLGFLDYQHLTTAFGLTEEIQDKVEKVFLFIFMCFVAQKENKSLTEFFFFFSE
jgi:hypothetical protein